MYHIFVTISVFLLGITIKLNSTKLCALIIWLNIRKIKIIKSNSNKPKNILVFPKTGGYEDLVESYRNNDNNLNFYVLPRFFLKKYFLITLKKNIREIISLKQLT